MARNRYRPGRTVAAFFIGLALAFGLVAVNGSWSTTLGLDLQGGTRITLIATGSPSTANLEGGLPSLVEGSLDFVRARCGGSEATESGEYDESLVREIVTNALVHRDLRLELRTALSRAVETNEAAHAEQVQLGLNGHRVLVDITVEPVLDGPVGHRNFVVLFKDGPVRLVCDRAADGGGTVHAGDDADIVAGGGAAVGALIAHEGARLVFGGRRFRRGIGGGRQAVVLEMQIVAVNVIASLHVGGRAADRLSVLDHGAAGRDIGDGDLVAGVDLLARGNAGDDGSGLDRRRCDGNVISGRKDEPRQFIQFTSP